MDRAVFISLCFEVPDDTQYPTGVIGLQFGSNFSGNVCFVQEPVFFPWERFYKKIDNPYGKQFTCYARDILGKPPFKVFKITGTDYNVEELVAFNDESVDFNKPIKLKAGTDYLELTGGKNTYKYLYIPNAGFGTSVYPLLWVDSQAIFTNLIAALNNNSDLVFSPPQNAKIRFDGNVHFDNCIFLKAGGDYMELTGGKDTYKYLYIPNAGLGTFAYPFVWVDAQLLYSQALVPLDNDSDFLVYSPTNAKLRFTGNVYIDSLPDM